MDPEDLIVPPVAEWSFLPEQQHAAKVEDDDEDEPDEDETPAEDDDADDDDDDDAEDGDKKPVSQKYIDSLKKRRREDRATYRARIADLESQLKKGGKSKDDDDEKPDLEKIRTELREELQAESHRDLRRIAAAGALEKAGIVGAGAKMVKLLDDEDLDALTVGKGGTVSGLDDLIADFKDENPSLFKKRRRDPADTGKDPDGESVRERGGSDDGDDATKRQVRNLRKNRGN
jgi:hypothetical protein